MQVVLVMFRSGGDQRSFVVNRDATVIGRREDCDLRIPVGDVSRKHCRLRQSDAALRLEDLGSSNGTFVNDERITETGLNAGDVIRVGPVQFVVQVDGVPADHELTRPPEPAVLPAGDSLAGDPLGIGDDPLPAGAMAGGETDDLLEPEGAVHATAAAEDEPFDLTEDVHPVATAGSARPNAMTIDQTPAEAGDFDDAFLDEGAGSAGEFSLEDEVPPAAAAALPADAEAELEAVELESLPATELHTPAAPGAAADEEDWDFMLEEPEGGHAGAEFHVGEDPTPHQQPHG